MIPCFTDKIKHTKQVRRRLEKTSKKSKLTCDEAAFKRQKNHVNRLWENAKTDYLSKKIEETGSDSKALFQVRTKVLFPKCYKQNQVALYLDM